MTLPSPTMQRCWAVRLQRASTCRISLSTHMQTHADTHTCRHPRTASTYTNTHIHRLTYTHGHRHTHTQKPTHYLKSLDLTLHTAHLTHNSHSDILRDEKCFRATRRLVFFSFFAFEVFLFFPSGLLGWLLGSISKRAPFPPVTPSRRTKRECADSAFCVCQLLSLRNLLLHVQSRGPSVSPVVERASNVPADLIGGNSRRTCVSVPFLLLFLF